MNFRALFLSMQRVFGIFSRRENDVSELMMKDAANFSPFAQIIGEQKYTVPDHPNPEVLKFIEYPTRPAGIQTFNEQSILSLYRDKLHSISMMLAISDGDIREDAYTFTNLVLKPLIEYIRWIHLLPASENHHHNGIGGLLSHSLEVAMISLKNANHSELRPIGYQDEEVVRRKVYLYGAFICGLVHDAGKVYDLDIVSLNLSETLTWAPSSQSLLDWARENNVVEYEIHWRKRIHNQHNIWSSVFLERILDPVCMSFLDRVKKERVYAKMVTALNVYNDGNDFLSKCVRTSDYYSTGTDLNVLRDPIMGLRSNDAAARAIGTIKHNFTSININNYKTKPMHIIIVNGEVYLNENAFLDFVLSDFAAHKFNFPQGDAGKTVLVESLVLRGYVEPYDDERVVHYFIPGTYSENEIASIFRNGIGKLEFYNLLKLRWIGLIFDSYKIPDSVPGLFSVNANKDFIYIDEQKTVTEYRRPVPGRESVTRVTDTVNDAIENTPQYGLQLVNGPDADSNNIISSENTESITDSLEESGADISNEIFETQVVTAIDTAETVNADEPEQVEEHDDRSQIHLVEQLHEMLLSAPLPHHAVINIDSVPYLDLDAAIALIPGIDEAAFCNGPFFQLTYRDGSLDGMWIVRDVNNLRLIQLGDNCAGMQVSTSEPRNTSSLKSLFDTSMYQPLDIPEAPSVNEAASPPQTPLELPQPRLNAPVAEEASSVAEQTNAHSEPDSVIATEYEQYGHLLEETLDSDGEAYSDLIASDSTEAEYPATDPQSSDFAQLPRETALSVAPGDLDYSEGAIKPPAPDATGKETILTSPEPAEDVRETVAAVEKASHLSPALARLFAVSTHAEKKHEKTQEPSPVKEVKNPTSSTTVKAPISIEPPGAEEKEAVEEFTLLNDGEVTELEYVEIATMLHQILTKLSGSFKRKRKNRFMVLTQNTFYLTQSCIEKYGTQLNAPELFNQLPQYQVTSGAVVNTKCIAFNIPTLVAASDRAKVDIELIINKLKEVGNL
ncbi:helicase [Salmonella enterica subsp. enterica serovar Stanley]|nr:helicase [Salmonella enterica subsp. enterica serovar Stanley]